MIIWYSFSIGTIATQMYFKYSYTFYLPAGYLKMRSVNIYWRKVTEGKTPRPARVIDVMKISYSNWRANSSTSIDSVAIYKRQFPCTVENEVRKSRLVFGHISPIIGIGWNTKWSSWAKGSREGRRLTHTDPNSCQFFNYLL